MNCLDDATLFALTQGALPTDALADLDEHLDHCLRCRDIVVTLARVSAPAAAAPYLRLGATVDRYVVLQPLGAGAMGLVYEAYDPKLNRRIALKILSPESSSAAEREGPTLVQEAQAMAQLAHPHVRGVYDVGTADGRVFIAMEHVEGMTLSAWLRQSTHSSAQILAKFVDVADGVAAAHAAGVIHGDLKPDNVLVGTDGRVRVTDFGLSRSPASSSTGTAVVAGTPRYMAPEQRRGLPVDTLTDQYSLCVALSEALSGGLGQHEPELRRVPAALRRLLAKGAHVDPAQRHPSVSALVHALRRFQQRKRLRIGVGVAFAATLGLSAGIGLRVSERSQLCRGGARRWATVWGVEQRSGLVRALEGTGLPYVRAEAPRATQLFDTYGQRWIQNYDEACEATSIRGEQSAELMDRRINCLNERLAEVNAVVEILSRGKGDTTEHVIEAAAGLSPLEPCANGAALGQVVPLPQNQALRANIEKLSATLAKVDALRLAGKYAEGVAAAKVLASSTQSVAYAPLKARVALALGKVLTLAGDRKAAEAALIDGAARAIEGKDGRTAAESWIALVGVVSPEPDRERQADEWDRYASAALEVLGRPPEIEGLRLLRRGQASFAAGRYSEAAETYERGLALWRRALSPDDPRLADAWALVASNLERQARYSDAMEIQKQGFDLRRRVLGEEHPLVATSIDAMGRLFAEEGKLDQALAANQHALELRQRALGPEHPSVANSFNNVSIIQAELQRYDEARASVEKALAIKEHLFGRDSLDYAISLPNLANIDAKQGKLTEAEALYERVLSIRELRLGANHTGTADAHDGVARMLIQEAEGPRSPARADNLKRAEQHEQRALEIYEAALQPDHPRIATFLRRLGEIRIESGDPTSAIDPLERALVIDRRLASPGLSGTLFQLARALFDSGKDRSRARSLCDEARTLLQHDTGERRRSLLPRVDAWVKAHSTNTLRRNPN